MFPTMNNPTQQSSPALRIEALSINCILWQSLNCAGSRNLLIVAESLTVHNVEYLLLLRLIILIHLTRRTPKDSTGNGVKMEIQYDPIKRRPVGLVTKLASGNIESATSYTYDQKSNITQIADTIVNGRTQDFVYDAQNRLTQASGKYGVENYTYTDNGNLTKRGQFTLAYGDANHKHAVTAVTSPNTGTFNYAYDKAGNMISH